MQFPPELVAIIDRADRAVGKINGYIKAVNKASKTGNRSALLRAASRLRTWTAGELKSLRAQPFAPCVAEQLSEYRYVINSYYYIARKLRDVLDESRERAKWSWISIRMSQTGAYGSLQLVRIGIFAVEPVCP